MFEFLIVYLLLGVCTMLILSIAEYFVEGYIEISIGFTLLFFLDVILWPFILLIFIIIIMDNRDLWNKGFVIKRKRGD